MWKGAVYYNIGAIEWTFNPERWSSRRCKL